MAAIKENRSVSNYIRHVLSTAVRESLGDPQRGQDEL